MRIAVAVGGTMLVASVALRAVLPGWIEDRLRSAIHDSPEVVGTFSDVDVCLLCGSFRVESLDLRDSDTDRPLFTADSIVFSMLVTPLFEGRALGRVELETPNLSIVARGGTAGLGSAWRDLAAALPLPPDEVHVERGSFRIVEATSDSPLDLSFSDVELAGRRLTEEGGVVEAHGHALGHGRFEGRVQAKSSGWDLSARFEDLQLADINDHLRKNLSVDAEGGSLEITTNLHGEGNRFEGKVHGVVRDAKLVDLEDLVENHPLRSLWEALAGGVVSVAGAGGKPLELSLKISGSAGSTDLDPWAALGIVLRSAILRAFSSPLRSLLSIADLD